MNEWIKNKMVLPLLLVVMFLICFDHSAVGLTSSPAKPSHPESPKAAETAAEKNNNVPEVGKIDVAGSKVGEKIEQFADTASGRVGGWINSKVLLDISWLKLFFCLLLIFVVVIVERMVRWMIQRRMASIPQVDGKIAWSRLLYKAVMRPLSLIIWVFGIYGALSPIYVNFQAADGSNLVHLVMQKTASVGGILALFWFAYLFINVVDVRLALWAKSTESTIDDILVPLFGKTLRIFIVILAGIVIFQNLTGVEIGPLLASLGIGGLAVALAAKDSIANFFGTLTILFDKPFQVGQRIVIDSTDGTVESVGFRSTRIRTLAGHLVTIPNEKLVSTSIENIGQRPHIRWLSNITITYDTPPEKVEKAVAILQEILDNHEGMHPDFPPRVYFNGFNEWSLNILMIAWYHPADFWGMQEWQQKTCITILKRFEAEGIEFAFPSRTVYLADNKSLI